MQLAVTDSLTRRATRPSPGACLQFDAFDSDMRIRFLELLVLKLQDQAFLDATGFRSAFFRNVEMVKMGDAPIDVTYSLLFTGLELMSRKVLRYNGHNLSELLSKCFDQLGIAITTDEANQIAACRNALFHRGEYEAEYQHSKSNSMRAADLAALNRKLHEDFRADESRILSGDCRIQAPNSDFVCNQVRSTSLGPSVFSCTSGPDCESLANPHLPAVRIEPNVQSHRT